MNYGLGCSISTVNEAFGLPETLALGDQGLTFSCCDQKNVVSDTVIHTEYCHECSIIGNKNSKRKVRLEVRQIRLNGFVTLSY